MKYVVKDTGSQSRKLGTSKPLECLNRSWGAVASLLRPGDRLDGRRIEQKLVDEDGELVFVLEDGSFVEIDPPFEGV